MKLQMGIVKVEIKIPELVKAVEVFKENNHKLFEVITSEVKSSVTTCLKKADVRNEGNISPLIR